jgi:hypothetical protein
MNIFVLDKDPRQAAEDACDKLVVKMVLETAQLLCSVFPQGEAPYRRTHYNHPCSVWTREAMGNYHWLIEHGLALADEYRYRYGKTHKSEEVIRWCDTNWHRAPIPHDDRTPFAQAMPEQYRQYDAVEAYRAYYLGSKSRFAQWSKTRPAPYWWTNSTLP